MRALVDLPEDLLLELGELSKKQKISRAEIIRRALKDFAKNSAQKSDGFGIWASAPIDGLALQEKLREEW